MRSNTSRRPSQECALAARRAELSSFHLTLSASVNGMRIAYVLNSLGRGGAERMALAVADRTARRGHAVSLLVLGAKLVDEWPTRLPAVYLDASASPQGLLRALAGGRRFLREFQPDLLHSHSFHANIFARLLAWPSTRVRAISTIHNVCEGGRVRMTAYRLTDPLASSTVAVSQAAADRFVRLKAIAPQKCRVIPNGIDAKEFAPDLTRRNETRRAMEAGSSFVWLAVGRLVPAKDFPNLLGAFERVRAVHPGAQLWIAGASMHEVMKRSEDGVLPLENAAHEHRVTDNVHWLGLWREMPAIYDAADAFVLSSAWEGMPLAVAEAMAMGKPVVATDVGGTRELVGDAGALVPARSSAALATAMIAMMDRPAEARASLGRCARARMASQFNIDARADEWEALYRSVITASA